jgi:Protein of unknown function (DUF1592)/Protein of unknown function (DUF1588)/PA14 domain/Cytochrome C oxidase, cbb3-type, subunit III
MSSICFTLRLWTLQGRFASTMSPFVMLLLLCASQTLLADDKVRTGEEIYLDQCAICHGASGQGADGIDVEPLHGDRSVRALSESITDTMPEQEPELCEGADAEKVARYIYDSFYSAEAWSRLHPRQLDLTHLTSRQYQNTVADLLASFGNPTSVGNERGLSAHYYPERQFRGKDSMQRIDPTVSFDFGEKTPDPKFENNEEFSIRWVGSILAEDTGDYEFVIRTSNGARLWVNDNVTPLIDHWVSSAGEDTEHRETVRLLGGRAYPIRLDLYKYKDKTASISLEWKPPRKTLRVIPTRNLTPQRVTPTFVVTTAFPADDSISGYERGATVSREWDRAVTLAALEVMEAVVEQLDRLTGTKEDAENREEKARQFCRQFADRAFRRPLTEQQQKFFVATHFENTDSVTAAVKRSVLLTLKSPRFLYPTIERGEHDAYDAATRLALGLWDSLPDKQLTRAAAANKLTTTEQVSAQALRMLDDSRAKSKLRYFLHHWLQVDEKEGLTKDKDRYPDFNGEVLADLRTSLDLFLDDVLWSDTSDFREILLSDHLYLNERLSAFLGKETASDGKFHKVSMGSVERSGIITHPYLLATFAYFNISSPVHRGVFVTRRLLGRSLKPPPQAIEFKDGGFDKSMTTREKFALQTDPPACQSCHSVINPLGFSLEHFDAVGRFRKMEQEKPIDAVSDYTTVVGTQVRLSGARGLAEFLAGSNMAHGAFVDQIFHQAVKQPINSFGPTARHDLIESFVASDFNVQKLLVEVMKVAVLPRPE